MISAEYVSGSNNHAPDHLRHMQDQGNSSFNKQMFQFLDWKLELYSVDRLAVRHNAKIKRYNSQFMGGQHR